MRGARAGELCALAGGRAAPGLEAAGGAAAAAGHRPLGTPCGSGSPLRPPLGRGPSGSGKTSLLNMLAGQVSASAKTKLSGAAGVCGGPWVQS
jgi:hypothetical protein